jgi:hypothetical protein
MRLLRKILGGISLTAAMFVFQACYGTEPYYDYHEITFRVVDENDGHSLEGIQVMSQHQTRNDNDYEYAWNLLGYTDSAGLASATFETDAHLDLKFRFTDNDSVYAVKDTILNDYYVDTVDIVLSRVN